MILKPQLVFSPSFHDVRESRQQAHTAAEISSAESSSLLCYQAATTTLDFRPTLFEDISDFLDQKMAALTYYQHQVEGQTPPRPESGQGHSPVLGSVPGVWRSGTLRGDPAQPLNRKASLRPRAAVRITGSYSLDRHFQQEGDLATPLHLEFERDIVELQKTDRRAAQDRRGQGHRRLRRGPNPRPETGGPEGGDLQEPHAPGTGPGGPAPEAALHPGLHLPGLHRLDGAVRRPSVPGRRGGGGRWARLNGDSVMVIGHQKGRDMKENLWRNFGSPHPEGYRKALRLMNRPRSSGDPVITFIDTPGAYPGVGAEERGQAEAIARNLREMARLRVPMISVVIGEGGSGGALALGVTNRILMLEHSIYSVISPEGCAAILWRTADEREKAARALKLTSHELFKRGIADEIIPEPPGGAHSDWDAGRQQVKEVLLKHFQELKGLDPEALVRDRQAKFEAIGEWEGKA